MPDSDQHGFGDLPIRGQETAPRRILQGRGARAARRPERCRQSSPSRRDARRFSACSREKARLPLVPNLLRSRLAPNRLCGRGFGENVCESDCGDGDRASISCRDQEREKSGRDYRLAPSNPMID